APIQTPKDRSVFPTAPRTAGCVAPGSPARLDSGLGAWHELERRGSRLHREGAADDVCGIAAVLRAGGGIDSGGQVGILHRGPVFVDAASVNVCFVARLGATKPGGGAAIHRADEEVVAVADDPDRHRFAQRAVLPERRDLQLLRRPDLAELVARPCRCRGHWYASFSGVRRCRPASGVLVIERGWFVMWSVRRAV